MTRRALNRAIEPSAFFFILKTHLDPRALCPWGSLSTTSHVLFLAKDASSEAIPSIHHSASGPCRASAYEVGSLDVTATIMAFSTFPSSHSLYASRCSMYPGSSEVHSSLP